EDNGIGIAENHQSAIFQIFHRLSPKDQVGGEGLGLSVVKRIVERNEGDIRVESSPQEGSRFIVTMPAPPEGSTSFNNTQEVHLGSTIK
ncbi:MAG: hypothetical protein KDB32_13195, partial [Planctomycetes bacterium]|nr:hypothetical protein [Planctomycetota bacterium]